MEGVADLLHGVIATQNHGFCVKYNKITNPVNGTPSTGLFDDDREVFGCDAHFVCIKCNIPMLHIMLTY